MCGSLNIHYVSWSLEMCLLSRVALKAETQYVDECVLSIQELQCRLKQLGHCSRQVDRLLCCWSVVAGVMLLISHVQPLQLQVEGTPFKVSITALFSRRRWSIALLTSDLLIDESYKVLPQQHTSTIHMRVTLMCWCVWIIDYKLRLPTVIVIVMCFALISGNHRF